MPRGSKAKYTSKQKRQAEHIEDSEKKQGRSPKRAAQIAWATVNKETGGAGKAVKKTSKKKTKKKTGKKASKKTTKKASKKTTKKSSKKSSKKTSRKSSRKSTRKSRSK